MQVIPTLERVAQRSGYSLWTVRHAFSPTSKGKVSLRAGMRILKAAEELGLRPWHLRTRNKR